MFRNSFPFSFLFFVPILFLISPVCPASDFAVYRMQQFDLQGVSHGCRNAIINVEARPITASVYTRKCVVSKLKELAFSKYKEILQQNANGLLVLLPRTFDQISREDEEHLIELEHQLLSDETQLPVYFAYEDDKLLNIYEDLKSFGNADSAESALEAIVRSSNLYGFQFIINGPQSKALNDFEIVNLQGKLIGHGLEEQLPTVLVVAYYDAIGVAPSLARGSNSNGSGVVAILELIRLFSKLYSHSKSHPKMNLQFLLTGAGKLNYQGTKRWLEDHSEGLFVCMFLSQFKAVICIDSIGSGPGLFAHVSKPPKEGSFADLIIKVCFAARLFEMIHKKINLAERHLSWEHERFSINKLYAFTVSSFKSPRDMRLRSITDTMDKLDVEGLSRNIRIIADGLAGQIFNLSNPGSDIFVDHLSVNKELVSSWLEHISSVPRSAQLLKKDSPLISTFEGWFSKHLRSVKRHTFKADKREPEFVFYTGAEYSLGVYSVKPAVFDLILAVGIALYLGLLYLISQV
ncbi:hypothetical protein HELRODRAFT_71336 [Helobdella robusta]|uniref:BOS complex subunit NCLN n=1 Tax=Helobdella robusta TaxID=6412 RepID=T1G0J8_HELRO|nr:hypothetical protein HELRODRAFT_71336 [Helobdella robusta]ESO11566.1 hypothetical protein HELRODRAFT_71336 [Helobdella robusta]